MKPDKPDAKKPPTPRKVFDVMRPGKALASPTSRPLITGHKPLVHDTVGGVEAPALGKHKKIELAPSDDAPAKETKPVPEKSTPSLAPEPSKTEPAPQAAKPAEAAPVSAIASSVPEVPARKEALPPAPAETAEPTADDSMQVKLPSEGPMPPAPELETTKDDTPAPIPSQQEIIVGHHGAIDAPGQALLLLGLIILLALVAFDILLDADIVSMDGIPHTNFFK